MKSHVHHFCEWDEQTSAAVCCVCGKGMGAWDALVYQARAFLWGVAQGFVRGFRREYARARAASVGRAPFKRTRKARRG